MPDAATDPPPGRSRRSLLTALRRLLAERSRRGRIASYALAAAAAAGAVVLVVWLFPGREGASLVVVGDEAGAIPMEPPLLFWPGSGLVVSGRGLTETGVATLAIDGRFLQATRADLEGRFTETLALPRDVAPGPHRIEVRDSGSGRIARSVEIAVGDPATPLLDVQPRRAAPGEPVLVRGGGLRTGRRLAAVVVAPDGTEVARVEARVRRTGLVGVIVAIPDDAAPGAYAVRVQDRAGADAAPALELAIGGGAASA